MECTVWALLALSGAMDGVDTSHVQTAYAPDPGRFQEVMSARTLGPIMAVSPRGDMRVTVVASTMGSGQDTTSVRALLARPGQGVRWISLPFRELPSAIFVTQDHAIVCVVPTGPGVSDIVTLDPTGVLQQSAPLASVLPESSTLASGEPFQLVAGAEGAALAVTLSCGTMALIDVAAGGARDLTVCSLVLPPRHACGVDAWLEQARELARAGDKDAERFALEAALETAPMDPRPYRQLARFLGREGDPQGQIECLQKGLTRLHEGVEGAVTEHWRVGTPKARLAVEYVETARAVMGDAVAGDALDQTLTLYPCMEQAVLLQAELLLDADQPEAAEEFLFGALARLDADVDIAAAYHDVGRFLHRHGHSECALRFMRDAFALGNRSEYLLRSLADLHLCRSEADVAADYLSILADQWRATQNGGTEERRRLIGERRLQELELEIETILRTAVVPPSKE